MDPLDYAALDAATIARMVRDGEVSAREVTEAALSRIAATEPVANAFIHLDATGARAAAERIDAARGTGDALGPLCGVPVSVKDLVHVAGMPTSFGSAVLAGTMAPEDAVPVARLRAAGAVLVGKTTTPEFGHKPLTEGPLFGRTRNPWNPDFTCGGSSGGAAVSLALGQVPLAVGTDGGGSIRIPASACGVFGLKATLGRIPHVHAGDLFANNSFIGPMTRTAADLEAMYAAMAGPDPRDPWSTAPAGPAAPARPLRIGHAMTVGNAAVEPEVAGAVRRALSALEGLGHDLEEVAIDLARYEPGFRVHLETALAARAGDQLPAHEDRIDASLARTLRNGLARGGAEVQAAATARSTLFREIEALFGRIDVLVTPTLSAASLPLDTDPHGAIAIAGGAAGPIRATWYPYTFPLNLTGHPALSMPCGWTGAGLPVGLQIAARWHDEATLLRLASDLECALGTGLPDSRHATRPEIRPDKSV